MPWMLKNDNGLRRCSATHCLFVTLQPYAAKYFGGGSETIGKPLTVSVKKPVAPYFVRGSSVLIGCAAGLLTETVWALPIDSDRWIWKPRLFNLWRGKNLTAYG